MTNYNIASSKLSELSERFGALISRRNDLRSFMGKLDCWLMGAKDDDKASINKLRNCSDEFMEIIMTLSDEESDNFELKDNLICFAEEHLNLTTNEEVF